MRYGKRSPIRVGVLIVIVASVCAGAWLMIEATGDGLRPQDLWKAYPLDSTEGQPAAEASVEPRGRPPASGAESSDSSSSASLPGLLIGVLLVAAVTLAATALWLRRRASSRSPGSRNGQPEPPARLPDITEQLGTCEITWQIRGSTSRFAAVVRAADGSHATIAHSRSFDWPGTVPPQPVGSAGDAHRDLVRKLDSVGWEAEGSGAWWFEQRFRRVRVPHGS